MWDLITRMVSPGGQRGSLSVLFFHRVVAVRDPLSPSEPTAAEFDTMMGWVQKQFTVIPLSEAIQRLANGTLPPAAAAITFDDGYRDNLEVAAPILKRRQLPATLFAATGFLDGGIMFNDIVIETFRRTSLPEIMLPEISQAPLPLRSWEERRHAISVVLPAIKYLPVAQRNELASSLTARANVDFPRDLMMTTDQLRQFCGMGFEVGAHTANHPILSVLPDEEACLEISKGKAALEQIIDRKVGLFAYPNGRWGKDFDQRHLTMTKNAGFDAAFSTDPGVSTSNTNFWNLPRFTPWDKTATRFSLRMLVNYLAKSVDGK